MVLRIDLPDELVQRLNEVAADRGVPVEVVAAEAIAAHLPSRRHLAFVGMGSSDTGTLSENLKQLRREAFAQTSSDQV